ncbi:Nitrate reductase [compost metagenome]
MSSVFGKQVSRRRFVQGSALTVAAISLSLSPLAAKAKRNEVATAPRGKTGRRETLAACPYCGVGCGTILHIEDGKIVGVAPDPKHPTNKGLQCIKGLTANEPMYVDRLTDVLVRKDVWAEWKKPGHGDLEYVSRTKGSFDDDVWVKVPYHDASEMVSHKLAHLYKKYGGNSIGLYGSGQLTMEGQYLETKFMKAVLESNTQEANARMCMTSAVTGYIETLGSDTPPLCYDDIEKADFIVHFAHNARESHPIVFWRAADHKKATDIPTMVVDPRYTGTAQAYERINPANSVHAAIEPGGDISFLNAIAHVILTEHEDVVAYDFLKKHVTGWENYIAGIKARYSPEQTREATGFEPAFVRKVARMYADATRKGNARGEGGVVTIWGIGYNQSIHGQHRVISLINLHLLTGNIGRPGAGPFSMTGQPNAMGERFTGGLTDRLPFNVPASDTRMQSHLAKVWNVPVQRLQKSASSLNPGYAVGMMERALKGEVKAMFFIYATHVDLPEVKTLVRPAMEKSFIVVQEIYRHAPNNLYGDVVFPAATWGEVGGTYINSERRIYVTDGGGTPPHPNCLPDMDIVIDKGKEICHLIGLPAEKIFPYRRRADGTYDPEEIFREICMASKGSDADLSGILEVEKETGKSPYEQLRELRGILWPAPTAEIAKKGGYARRYMGQEEGWKDRPYGMFRTQDGKAHMKLCEQDYSKRAAILPALAKCGVDPDFFLIDNMSLLEFARDNALTPEYPDKEYAKLPLEQVPNDKYPLWLSLGVVYEHFHTAKTVRSPTTRKLVPENYIEMHPEDAKVYGIKDGEWIRVRTRRGSFEAKVVIGNKSKVKPGRNLVPRGLIFGPWNLSVADSADPKKNKWLVNEATHRAFDPVSGQAAFKHSAARIEKLPRA